MSDLTPDKIPAHALWVELSTRITAQPLQQRSGDEEAAVRSVHFLFGKTRELMAAHPEALVFHRLAERFLNETLRPYTTRWHGWMVPDAQVRDKDGQPVARFRDPQVRQTFRAELQELQARLWLWMKVLDLLRQGQTQDEAGRGLEDLAFAPVAEMMPLALSSADAGRPDPSLGAHLPLRIGSQVVVAGAVRMTEIAKAEMAEIHQRRVALRLSQTDDKKSAVWNVAGLALSGGGIRSATFCLGITQVLARRGLFSHFDYLSTVSGGGYLGAFLSTALGTRQEGDKSRTSPESASAKLSDVFERSEGIESGLVRHLRNNSKYLLNGGLGAKLEIAGLLISGVLWNLLMLLPLPLLLAWAADAWQEWIWGAQIVSGSFKEPDWGKGRAADLAMFFGGVLALGWFTQPLVKMLSHGRDPKDKSMLARRVLEVALPWVGLAFVSLVVVNCVPTLFYGYEMLRQHYKELGMHWLQGTLSPDVLGLSAGGAFSATLALVVAKLAPQRERLRKLAVRLLILSGPVLLLAIFLAVGNRMGLGRLVEEPKIVPVFVVTGLTFLPEFSQEYLADLATKWSPAWVLTVALGIVLWGWLGVNINTLAPHIYYRNRLCDCYMVRRIEQDVEEPGWWTRLVRWLSGEHVHGRTETLQRVRFSSLNSDIAAPYHLVNMTLNVPSSSDKNLRGRASDFFVASRLYCGSPLTGYRKTSEVTAVDPHFDLGTAMAVSGAAASTSMGWKSLPNFRFLMTLFNVRLGYWLRWGGKAGLWHRLMNTPGPMYLFREMFAVMDERCRYLNLSDGGHIENLGVYELLRRQAKFIVCVDGGQEPGMECTDLTRLQRYAEIDLGIRLHFDLHDLALLEQGYCRAYGLLVKVDYEPGMRRPASESKVGWMLYLKLAMTGTEPAHVLEYKRTHADFPHQTTGDQFFDEAQFEAYRQLGECAMESFFHDEFFDASGSASMAEWFQHLAGRLLPDNDSAFQV